MISRMQQAMQQIAASQEPKSTSADELRRLQRRHADATDKVAKAYDRASHAAKLRDSFWRRHAALKACVDGCQKEVSALAASSVSIDDKLIRYEVSALSVLYLLANILVIIALCTGLFLITVFA
jgi:phage shock protein A